MAELRSTAAVGGNIIWHKGNLRVFPQGESLLYGENKVFTEYDKPDPHTDLTEPAIVKSGDDYQGTLTYNGTDYIALNIVGADVNNDVAIQMGSSAEYAWELFYRGTSNGLTGNEFIVKSTGGVYSWEFGHDGKMLFVGGGSYEMLHEGNLSLADTRFVKKSGDTMTGVLKTQGGDNVQLSMTNFEFRSRDGDMYFGPNNGGGNQKLIFETNTNVAAMEINIDGNDSFVDVKNELLEQGERVFSPNNRNISSSVISSDLNVYASSNAVKKAYDNANTRVSKSGDIMTGNLEFEPGLKVQVDGGQDYIQFNTSADGYGLDVVAWTDLKLTSKSAVYYGGIILTAGENVLNIGGASQSDDYFTYNGNKIIHAGNYSTHLDGRYINATGDSMTGDLTIGGNAVLGTSTAFSLELNESASLNANNNTLKIIDDDTTDGITYNDSVVQHDGRSEMKFNDGMASIQYNSELNSIDFIFG